MTSADKGFDKSYRLLSAEDFSYLKKDAKSFSSKWVRIFYKPTRTSTSNSRIGIAVSKKVGKANKRNLCKRVIREYFRNSEYRNSGLDFLVVVSNRLFKNSEDPKKDLKSAIKYSLKKINS